MKTDHVTMGSNGRIVIPASIRNQLGMPQGGSFVAHVENGEVRLEPIAHAIARVQALLDDYVPRDVSLADELSAERRAAAERE
jgi:AbrB family looped-hinge helix DNA binding protein